MNKLSEEELKNISGGSTEETRELRAFIQKHVPGYEIDDDYDVYRWLFYKSGLSWDSVDFTPFYNRYVLAGGKKISHAELMDMLNERYPD